MGEAQTCRLFATGLRITFEMFLLAAVLGLGLARRYAYQVLLVEEFRVDTGVKPKTAV